MYKVGDRVETVDIYEGGENLIRVITGISDDKLTISTASEDRGEWGDMKYSNIVKLVKSREDAEEEIEIGKYVHHEDFEDMVFVVTEISSDRRIVNIEDTADYEDFEIPDNISIHEIY